MRMPTTICPGAGPDDDDGRFLEDSGLVEEEILGEDNDEREKISQLSFSQASHIIQDCKIC